MSKPIVFRVDGYHPRSGQFWLTIVTTDAATALRRAQSEHPGSTVTKVESQGDVDAIDLPPPEERGAKSTSVATETALIERLRTLLGAVLHCDNHAAVIALVEEGARAVDAWREGRAHGLPTGESASFEAATLNPRAVDRMVDAQSAPPRLADLHRASSALAGHPDPVPLIEQMVPREPVRDATGEIMGYRERPAAAGHGFTDEREARRWSPVHLAVKLEDGTFASRRDAVEGSDAAVLLPSGRIVGAQRIGDGDTWRLNTFPDLFTRDGEAWIRNADGNEVQVTTTSAEGAEYKEGGISAGFYGVQNPPGTVHTIETVPPPPDELRLTVAQRMLVLADERARAGDHIGACECVGSYYTLLALACPLPAAKTARTPERGSTLVSFVLTLAALALVVLGAGAAWSCSGTARTAKQAGAHVVDCTADALVTGAERYAGRVRDAFVACGADWACIGDKLGALAKEAGRDVIGCAAQRIVLDMGHGVAPVDLSGWTQVRVERFDGATFEIGARR